MHSHLNVKYHHNILKFPEQPDTW